ncbi:MAG: hypothetical protein DME46_04360 [Verrucomicrobia bacterium]|nr:MAG: hypothetical protein DME46_04360 [Verrucomicrobiota bacterium]
MDDVQRIAQPGLSTVIINSIAGSNSSGGGGAQTAALPGKYMPLTSVSTISCMKAKKEELLDIIYQSLDEVNEQLPNEARIQKSPDAALVGGDGGLDSLGVVNFVALVEEKCARKYGIALSLTDTPSEDDDALEDVGKFADFLFRRLNEISPVEL